MIEAYTDHYLPILGDWNHIPIMRKVSLTRYDGHKECRGVINGVIVRLPLRRVYKDAEKSRLKKSELMSLLYTEVI
jgi:hypothetical protein